MYLQRKFLKIEIDYRNTKSKLTKKGINKDNVHKTTVYLQSETLKQRVQMVRKKFLTVPTFFVFEYFGVYIKDYLQYCNEDHRHTPTL